MTRQDFNVQRDAAALQFMILDMLENILRDSDNPGSMGRYLTRQIRELVGGRIVLLLQCLSVPGHPAHRLVSVTPERYRTWAELDVVEDLAILSHHIDRCTLWESDSAPADVQALLTTMKVNAAIVLPLQAGSNRVGHLLVLDLLDMWRAPEILRALDFLSPVVALILRNALLYELQELEIQARTRELEVSEKRFRSLAQLAPVGIFRLDAEGRFIFTNDRWRRITGLSPGARDVGEWYQTLHPDDRTRVSRAWREAEASRHTFRTEYRVPRKDGEVAWVIGEAEPELDENGAVCGYIGTLTDITDHKRAEEERERLEEQLRQAHKMEAVGRLAGGVAHDFNNMLAVILGYAEILKTGFSADDHRLRDLLEMEKAAIRSRDLTRQLLAFSRKQIISPRPVDVNVMISEMHKTLVRLISEDIDLRFYPADDLWKVRMDPSQVDQILVNLAVNARDAMPEGGRLTIETANVYHDEAYCREHLDCMAGSYVVLVVSDEGLGMDKETLLHIFEPFFTTKDASEGSGLGLATVYGIARQNGGFINVYSEPGQGTTFKVYIPRLMQEAQTPMKAAEVRITRGAGTILLVEDDEMMRGVAASMLKTIGYSVLEAAKPRDALELCENCRRPIDLLLTDVVMPGMSGKELADKIGAVRPGTGVLFMSGYTSNVIAHRGVLDEGVHFIQKPFSMGDLSLKIEEAMGGRVEVISIQLA